MAHIKERLVLDWRRKAETREAARVLVKDVLDELPDAYDPETWERKTDVVFNHIFASYYDDGRSVYDEPTPALASRRRRSRRRRRGRVGADDVDIDDGHAGGARADQDRPRARRAGRRAASRARRRSSRCRAEELIAGDETYEVEFKSTARWNLRERAARTSGWRTPS